MMMQLSSNLEGSEFLMSRKSLYSNFYSSQSVKGASESVVTLIGQVNVTCTERSTIHNLAFLMIANDVDKSDLTSNEHGALSY